jgi:DNA segregation ATPase FtsK/SpoIIIE-like protein
VNVILSGGSYAISIEPGLLARVLLETERGSVSLLRRRLTIGYRRNSRLIEAMASAGIVGS